MATHAASPGRKSGGPVDDDTGSGFVPFQYVVVYDPGAGFVTGGGGITSPAGAYAANPALTGRANFGFNAKYKKGAQVPDGQTEFQFQAAGLNFHSTAFEWLVVSGARAQYKGTGTVNGNGSYSFLLSRTPRCARPNSHETGARA